MAEIVPTTRGTILRSLVRFVQNELTPAQYQDALSALPASDRELIEELATFPRERVPEFVLNRRTAEAARAMGEEREPFGRRAGRAEITDAVGVYRFFFLVATPAAMLRKAPSLWASVHSHGRMTVHQQQSAAARIRLANFPSEPAHCARLAGWFEGAGEMSGAHGAQIVHDVCMMRGGADCQWLLTWSR